MESKLLTEERFVDRKTGFTYRYVFSDTEYFRPHTHEYYELFLMLDGSALHIVNGAELPLSRGDLVFIRPFDDHDYIGVGQRPFSLLNIAFSARICDMLFEYLGEGFKKSHLLGSFLPPEVRLNDYELERFSKMMDNIRAIDPKNYDEIGSAFRILIFNVFTRYFSEGFENEEKLPVWLEEMCNKVKKDGNFSKGSNFFFGLTDKSREHVSRTVKKYMGMTVSEYINGLRLNFIANMLKNSNHSVSDIIFESGFNNISWAAELFKARYGVTMREYRKGSK